MQLDDTAALVTGAASGLGAATAAHLAERGARVYGLDLDKAVTGATTPAGVQLIAADVTDDEQVRAAVERIRDDGQQLRPSTVPASHPRPGSCPEADRTTSTSSTPCSRSTCSAPSTCSGWLPRR
jgi:NAD(P)-dependent dehydrogenase (short-subunit alcohol dehydrogenase family)